MGYTKTIYRKHLQAHDYDTGAHKYVKVVDKKATTVAGGGSSATTWNVRALTDIIDNTVSPTGVSLATNTLTLPIGTYQCRVSAPVYGAVGSMQLKLVDTAPASDVDLIEGTVSTVTVGTDCPRAELSGQFTLTTIGTIQVQHYTTSAVATNGLGYPGSIGGDEIYTIAEFWMEQDPSMDAKI